MFASRVPFALSLMAVVLLSACQPKPDPEDSAASAASSAMEVTQSLQTSVMKVPVTLPACKGNSCPEFSVQRLSSNYPAIDQAIDVAIVQGLANMLDVDGSNGSPASSASANNSSANSSSANGSATNKSATSGSSTSDAAAIQAAANVSEVAASTAVSLTAEQLLAQNIQPYVSAFLAIDQEMKSLGTAHGISLMLKPAVLQSNGSIATVVLNSSSYLGGAHGAAAQQYFNFDLTTQQPLVLNDLIVSGQKQALSEKAHTVFAKWVVDNKLATNLADYEQAWPFKLSDNFYLAPQGLILQYGEYDIGPYVVGLPRLIIPYAQLQGILKPAYLPANLRTVAAASNVKAS